MSTLDWTNILGWQEAEIEDIRFVGYTYIKQGKWDMALTFFEALKILSPDNLYDLQMLGALYLQKGSNFQALNYIEKALKLDPLHEPTLLNKMRTLFALGFRKEGLAQANELLTSKDRRIAAQAQALLLSYS